MNGERKNQSNKKVKIFLLIIVFVNYFLEFGKITYLLNQ